MRRYSVSVERSEISKRLPSYLDNEKKMLDELIDNIDFILEETADYNDGKYYDTVEDAKKSILWNDEIQISDDTKYGFPSEYVKFNVSVIWREDTESEESEAIEYATLSHETYEYYCDRYFNTDDVSKTYAQLRKMLETNGTQDFHETEITVDGVKMIGILFGDNECISSVPFDESDGTECYQYFLRNDRELFEAHYDETPIVDEWGRDTYVWDYFDYDNPAYLKAVYKSKYTDNTDEIVAYYCR